MKHASYKLLGRAFDEGTWNLFDSHHLQKREAYGRSGGFWFNSCRTKSATRLARRGRDCQQAYTKIAYGTEGLTPEQTLKRLLADDPQREKRQVATMDFAGRKAVFTGTEAPKARGEIVGEGYVVIGNLLKDVRALEDMAKRFEETDGNLVLDF